MRSMPAARTLVLAFACALGVALVAAACGGDDGATTTGRLTDPRSVPTATPWPEPPDPIILDPNALTPIGGSENETPEPDNGTPAAGDGSPTAGTCGSTYTVEGGDVPFSIAEKCGIPADEIRDWVDAMLQLNDTNATSLRVGQELKLPQ